MMNKFLNIQLSRLMARTVNRSQGNPPKDGNTIGLVAVVFGLAVASLLLGSCQSSISKTQTAGGNSDAAITVKSDGDAVDAGENGKEVSEEATSIVEQTGVELWADNCQRCHNYRDPSIYTDAEWDVAMFHMRTRANLTASDYRKIRDFILSAN